MNQSNDFKGTVAIVTGGGSGIGAALCTELYRKGASVVVADWDEASAQLVCSQLSGGDGHATAFRADVRDPEALAGLVARTVELYGKLDLFINNAGILSVGEIRDLTLANWRPIIETNLFGVINGTQAAYATMLRQGSGHIVNMASLAALVCSPLYAPYAASKAAVVALSAALRLEAAPLGIKVSTVCPGNVETKIFDSSEVVNARRSDVFKKSALYPTDAAAAARAILTGIKRNQQFIVFPFYAKALWWLYRLSPAAVDFLSREVVRRFRTARTAQ